MKISEVIKKLQEIQAEHGDIEVLALYDTYGTSEFIPLEDDGIIFVRLKSKNVLYIGW